MAEKGNEVGFSEEFMHLTMQHGMLKEKCADAIERLTSMVEVKGPNLKASYMMHVGQYECRVFELQTAVKRWQRRLALVQAAINAGEEPDLMAIEAKLNEEFEEFIEKVKANVQEIREASCLFHSGSLSEEDVTKVRAAYLDAVKRLHPDLNPNLPPAAADLWNQIQKAYAEQDWGQVRFLAGLVDGVVDGTVTFEASENGLEELRKACERLKLKAEEIEAKIADLEHEKPFCYSVILESEELLADKQQELMGTIKALKAKIRTYEELWEDAK